MSTEASVKATRDKPKPKPLGNMDDSKEERKSHINLINAGVKKNKTIWVCGQTAPFQDEYTQMEQLGNAGQYGVTYKCQRKSDNQYFAVKLLNKNRFYRINVKHRQRYLQSMCDEIDVLRTLQHSYIVRLKDVYEDKTTLYIVMEYCEGGELFQRVVKKGKYTEKAAANVVKQLLSALRYMHDDNGIVHCDLKPDNILFLTQKEDSPLKIIDFGMSKILPRLQYLTHLCGTPYYTAPEVIKNRKYNHSCDMWSVGVILYVMIYGYPPFYVDPNKYGNNERNAIYQKIIRGFNPVIKDTKQYGYGPWFPDHIETSKEVKELISKLLQKQVRKRYTAKEALTHPWVVNRAQHKDAVNKHMVSRLVGFNNVCQFKLVITKIFRNQFYKMRPEHFHQLEQLFIKFDKNNDGILSFDEFKEAIVSMKGEIHIDDKHLVTIYEQLSASQSYNNMSDNKAIGIQFSDLLNALVYDYLISCDERLYDAFRKLDDDNDGKITTKELKEKLKEIDPLGEWDHAMRVIEEHSFDQNGVIDYEEFLLNLHPNFEETPEWMPELFKQMSSVQFGKQEFEFKEDKKNGRGHGKGHGKRHSEKRKKRKKHSDNDK